MNEDRTSGSGDSMGRGRDLSRSRDLLGTRGESFTSRGTNTIAGPRGINTISIRLC